MKRSPVNRRRFVRQAGGALFSASLARDAFSLEAASGPHQAMGTRVGEITADSAIVWTRLTSIAARHGGTKLVGPVDELEGACPGSAGKVRLRYATREDLTEGTTTNWEEVSAEGDFIHQFHLTKLKSGTTYYFASESMGSAGNAGGMVRGKFQTAPDADAPSDFLFCVMTCQGYKDRGHPDGHDIYPSMLALSPAFTCLTGDLVYYDNDKPSATSLDLARYHWQRMFSLPRLVEFNRQMGTYWLKDDHDTLNNDSWPGMKSGTFTFAEGQKLFRQQAPMAGGPSYRTIRWGRDLQLWFTDGRDFRSPNKLPDGPEKTIWGAEQKAWFKKTAKESAATWKVLISPTPMVGPDRGGKNDNHTNAGFQHEGDELRGWIKENVPDNFFVICGDRHWQYHSVHPQTGLHEFSVGPASNEHAGGSPGLDKNYHRFHRVKGGFLSVSLKAEGKKSTILFQHRDVHGAPVHDWSAERKA